MYRHLSVCRYVIVNYKWTQHDGRISYPLLFLYVTPHGCSPHVLMTYTGMTHPLMKLVGPQRIIDLQDLDELTEEFIVDRLRR